MTIWDNIYKNYQKGGEAWATLSEEIHPLFKQFLSQSHFERRHVLDIGCGTGKYLSVLQAGGFKTDGIDSSETAVDMTKITLGSDSIIVCTNMFEFDIPKNKYDLVISISTIHHGTKEQVQNLVNRIYEAIVEKGLPHSFYTKEEVKELFSTFKDLQLDLDSNERWIAHAFK